jgi:basic amino acid/polyamine antiporter, APA family
MAAFFPVRGSILPRRGMVYVFGSSPRVHPRYQMPGFAILAQDIWAVVLVVSGSYETLLDYAMFALWLSYGLMVAGLIVLRHKQPDLARSYRVSGYPVTPLWHSCISLS